MKKAGGGQVDDAITTALKTCSEVQRAQCPWEGPRFCSLFWRRVFILHFGKEPENDEDPLWDTLFSAGFPALNKIHR